VATFAVIEVPRSAWTTTGMRGATHASIVDDVHRARQVRGCHLGESILDLALRQADLL
jgi:hypothetical protein